MVLEIPASYALAKLSLDTDYLVSVHAVAAMSDMKTVAFFVTNTLSADVSPTVTIVSGASTFRYALR